jgi:hypothetical protein
MAVSVATHPTDEIAVSSDKACSEVNVTVSLSYAMQRC